MTRDEQIAALESALDDLNFRGGEEEARESIHAVLASLRADVEAPAHAPVTKLRAALVAASDRLHSIYGTASTGSWVLDLYEQIDAALSAAPPAPTPLESLSGNENYRPNPITNIAAPAPTPDSTPIVERDGMVIMPRFDPSPAPTGADSRAKISGAEEALEAPQPPLTSDDRSETVNRG